MADVIETNNLQEVALRSVLTRLQEIDTDNNSRGRFASSIFMNQTYGIGDAGLFTREIELIQHALGIEPKKEQPVAKEKEAEEAKGPRTFSLDL